MKLLFVARQLQKVPGESVAFLFLRRMGRQDKEERGREEDCEGAVRGRTERSTYAWHLSLASHTHPTWDQRGAQ